MVQSTNDGKRSVSAQVTVKANGTMMSLRVFDEVVIDITEKRNSENITLVKARSFAMSHHDGIIQSVSREASI